MTTQKLSGLELARKWMDSLGMRHYGEVDEAIAEAGAGASGYSASQHPQAAPDLGGHCPPPWQEIGFAAYASRALEDQRSVGNDFRQLFIEPRSAMASKHCCSAEKLAWKGALQAAKDLVNGAALSCTGSLGGDDLKATTNLGQPGGSSTLNVRVNSINSKTLEHQYSIDVTCHSKRTLAIHIWI